MNAHIVKFLSENKVLTLATSKEGIPYCANCYYAFDSAHHTLIFLSDATTRHISEALNNKLVAGTVAKDAASVANIKGIQFTGTFISPESAHFDAARFYQLYYKKYPFAKAMPSSIWGISLEYIKMTDNTLGFGETVIWQRE